MPFVIKSEFGWKHNQQKKVIDFSLLFEQPQAFNITRENISATKFITWWKCGYTSCMVGPSYLHCSEEYAMILRFY
jgi:hypothetical protein